MFPTNFISLKEAAKISGYHPDYLSSLIREKKLFGERIGRSWCTTEEAVRAYLAGDKNMAKNQTLFSRKLKMLILSGLIIFLLILIMRESEFFYSPTTTQASSNVEQNEIVNTRITTFSSSADEVGVSVKPSVVKQ